MEFLLALNKTIRKRFVRIFAHHFFFQSKANPQKKNADSVWLYKREREREKEQLIISFP